MDVGNHASEQACDHFGVRAGHLANVVALTPRILPIQHEGSKLSQQQGGSEPKEDRRGRAERCEATTASGLSKLTSRELEVAELVARGHTNRQIAKTLCLSVKTIETYMSRLFTKLEVRSRAAVASVVVRRSYQSKKTDCLYPDGLGSESRGT